jgi:TIR domain
MDQIFISYARADKVLLMRLLATSRTQTVLGLTCDRADISGGDDWNTAISRAIRACSYFLLVCLPIRPNQQRLDRSYRWRINMRSGSSHSCTKTVTYRKSWNYSW